VAAVTSAEAPEHTTSPEVERPVSPGKPAARGRPIAALVVSLAVAAIGYTYVTRHGRERTDDAQVDAEVVAVPSRAGGVVAKVRFTENQRVKKGDVLAELDAAPQKARLAQAEAAVAQAEAAARAADEDAKIAERNARGQKSIASASLSGAAYTATQTREQIAAADARVLAAKASFDEAKLELDRIQSLFDKGALPASQLDRAKSAHENAKAGYEQAKSTAEGTRASVGSAQSRVAEASARLEQASDVDAFIAQAHARAETARASVQTARAARDIAALELSWTSIVAPHDGIVSKKSISEGQMIGPGTSVGMLVPDAAPWVVANFKETQLGAMHVGQPVIFTVDAYPGRELRGEIESMSAATGSRFSLLPPDNASGNYTKVVQRIPVRIKAFDVPEGVSLRPGMSVEVVVDVRK
jgi:membrane fusion protein (multidrug efflux system)